MINLITGIPGSGKTTKAIELLFELCKQNEKIITQGRSPRHIFTNLDSIHLDVYYPLPMVNPLYETSTYFGPHDKLSQKDQYWLPPENSIFIIDESHSVDWLKNTPKNIAINPQTLSLSRHKECGHDFYLTAQRSELIHPFVQNLIDHTQHLEKDYTAIYQPPTY